jgi:hypothetical protein
VLSAFFKLCLGHYSSERTELYLQNERIIFSEVAHNTLISVEGQFEFILGS